MVDAGVAVAFGESSAVLASDEGEVGVGGGLVAECVLDCDLSCCGVGEVVSSDDLGDGLLVVIDDDGELVARAGPLGPDDEVAGGCGWVE